jgi:hypothetical protein
VLSSALYFTDRDVKQTLEIKNRGYGFLVPMGKMLTQHEEKNDVRTLRRGIALHSHYLNFWTVLFSPSRQTMVPKWTNLRARRTQSRRRTRVKVRVRVTARVRVKVKVKKMKTGEWISTLR